jgi:citronellol/citronellal dehydrogenase
MPLDGKVAIVAGATRGIGHDIALYLARAGATVVVAARSAEVRDPRWPVTIHDVVKEIEDEGGKAIAVQLDLRYPESCAECVRTTVEQLGRLDILVNNAAVQARGTIETMDPKYVDLMFQVNVRGPLLMIREAIPHMRKAGGHVINISSRGAVNLPPGPYPVEERRPTSYFYGPTKAALDRLNQQLALEHQVDNISFNCLSPDRQVTTPGVALLRNVDDPDAPLLDVEVADDLGKSAVWICEHEPGTYTGNILYDKEVVAEHNL